MASPSRRPPICPRARDSTEGQYSNTVIAGYDTMALTEQSRDVGGDAMTQHDVEPLTFQQGDAKSLPHTLSTTRHLTLTLMDFDPAAGTATFELHNPEAQPDEMVSGLIEQNLESVERANGWRDKLHLPEKTVPVDTSTNAVETLHCSLGEKLQIGDRVWTVTAITADSVALTPGADHEAHTLANKVEDLEYSPEAIAIAQDLSAFERDL